MVASEQAEGHTSTDTDTQTDRHTHTDTHTHTHTHTHTQTHRHTDRHTQGRPRNLFLSKGLTAASKTGAYFSRLRHCKSEQVVRGQANGHEKARASNIESNVRKQIRPRVGVGG